MKRNKFTITLAILVVVSFALSLGFQGRSEKQRTLRGVNLTVDADATIGGTLTVTGTITQTGAATLTGNTIYTPTTVASAAGSVTLPAGTVIWVTGTASITRLATSTAGRIVYLFHATTDTLVDGGNLKLAGNFNGTADDCLTLMYGASGAAADTFWTEISRAVN